MIRITIFLLIAILLPGCYSEPFDYDLYESEPVVKVELSISGDTQVSVENYLKEFAGQNGYRLRVARINPNEPEFSIMMWRNDSIILAANPYGKYSFGIYRSKNTVLSKEAIDSLETMLKELDKNA